MTLNNKNSSSQNNSLVFQPHPLIRNRHSQTIISSFSPIAAPQLSQAAQDMILTVCGEVRLQGIYSPQPAGQTKGLVLILHGWHGWAGSNYTVSLGEALYRKDYAIFRLNLRDHGGTHYLNPGFFRADLLDEVFEAAQQIAQLDKEVPFHVTGASLGGSFALRLAWRHSQSPIPNLHHSIAINPAVDPIESTLALDRNFIYLNYFRRRWRQSMKIKQQLFPELYDFSAELRARKCMDMHEILMRRYGPYPDAISYFKSYAVTPDMLSALRSPVTILTAADDPIVPVDSFYKFDKVSPQLQIDIQPYGGHVGFIDIFPWRSWVNDFILAVLESRT